MPVYVGRAGGIPEVCRASCEGACERQGAHHRQPLDCVKDSLIFFRMGLVGDAFPMHKCTCFGFLNGHNLRKAAQLQQQQEENDGQNR